MMKERPRGEGRELLDGTIGGLLLSHHPPRWRHRTLVARIPGGASVRLCARCTGVVAGAATGAGALCAGNWLGFAGPPPIWRAVLALAAALPAVVDYQRQACAGRESNNSRRLATGALFGFAAALAGAGVLSRDGLALAALGLAGAAWATWLFRGSGRANRIIEELAHWAEAYEQCRAFARSSRLRRFRRELSEKQGELK